MPLILYGQSLIAGLRWNVSGPLFRAQNPTTGESLEPAFHQCATNAVNAALDAAEAAFKIFRSLPAETRAQLLEAIAREVDALGDALLERAHLETGLPLDRLAGERDRTKKQLLLFAEVVREGSWCDARVDTAKPEREPVPRPDIRRMLIPLGPVIVFGASNFPLAYSVAGGDTASALAAGCPVIVKAHPAHPGTSELAASAINAAIASLGLPPGIFSMLHGAQEIGPALVRHPLTKAAGFTGSHTAGRALFDAATARQNPIPVFAEMSGTNPVFILPGAMKERGATIATELLAPVINGVGQFCTKPGLVMALEDDSQREFARNFAEAIRGTAPATMLHRGIEELYRTGVKAARSIPGVSVLSTAEASASAAKTEGQPCVLITTAESYFAHEELHREIFGPCTLFVTTSGIDELFVIAERLEGQLTATVHAADSEQERAEELIAILERKAGRIIFNGYPTGLELCHSIHHGGPSPSTTDGRYTSGGPAAILRWVRPVCYQNFPEPSLPPELQDKNPRGIMRWLNGTLTRQAVPTEE